jgi:hypothetical protein
MECCSYRSWKWWLKFLSRWYWCNSCCCFFLSLVVGGVIGAGITFCIFMISTNHGNTTGVIGAGITFCFFMISTNHGNTTGFIGAGITFCIFMISTNHGNTTQAIRRANLFQHKFLIAALNLHVTTHFHCFDILHLKQITFLRILVIFKMKNRFWFWAPHSLTPAVFFNTKISSHGTLPLMNFLWIKPSFRTCKFFGYFLTQYETSIKFTKMRVTLRNQ